MSRYLNTLPDYLLKWHKDESSPRIGLPGTDMRIRGDTERFERITVHA